MADSKVTDLTENTTPAVTDLLYIVDDPGGTPAGQKVTLANIKALVNDITTDAEWDAAGDLVYGTGANTADRLAIGTVGQVLTVNAGETAPEWANAASGDVATDAIFDAKGDLAVGTGANTAAKLTVGAANTFPMADAGETTGLKYALAPYHVCQGRLTLTTGVPVTTADVTAAATLYFTPYAGNAVGLFDGTYWDILAFSELSLDISGYTASKPYDIWIYNNSGTPTLDSTVWTNATTRATALTTQDGIYVKTGAVDRRYLGTIYINSSGGQTDDAATKRCVFNCYNRKARHLRVSEFTAHNYETGTWRSWNANDAVRVEYMLGVYEERPFLGLKARAETASVGVGYDATNGSSISELECQSNAVTGVIDLSGLGTYASTAVGYHFLQVVEYGYSGATQSYVVFGGMIWA